MKAKRKALVILFCAAAIATATAFSTLAYLTDTDSATNTFTVGKVDIELDEAKVDNSGVVETGVDQKPLARVTENDYHLIPGHTYVKDPTIHVQPKSEDCWLFVKVINNLATPFTPTGESAAVARLEAPDTSGFNGHKSIADQMKENGWVALEGVANVYYYAGTRATNGVVSSYENAVKDIPVFAEFTVDGSVTNEQLAAYLTQYTTDAGTANEKTTAVTVTAYAVQADGFNEAGKTAAENAAAAWNAAKFKN
ncbi:MAG: hypothetical protein E7662_02300 [Ruminococcaceae bacterium]|nr:hypothetical protein [Oscillospiraceae bacterium]